VHWLHYKTRTTGNEMADLPIPLTFCHALEAPTSAVGHLIPCPEEGALGLRWGFNPIIVLGDVLVIEL